MSAHFELDHLLNGPAPILALAPMQDVTDLPFMNLMTAYGGADLFFTQYFRVYETSCLDKNILKTITQKRTGKPGIAQMIGKHIPSFGRTARELQEYTIAAGGLDHRRSPAL